MRTVAELVNWFEDNFTCSLGFPGSAIDPEYKTRYITFAIRTQTTKESEAQLVKALQSDFILLVHNPLVWRYKEKIMLDHWDEQQVGKCLLTRENEQDGWPVPEGAVHPNTNFGYDSQHWYEDKGIVNWSILTTRLAIPILNWNSWTFRYAKAEGIIPIQI